MNVSLEKNRLDLAYRRNLQILNVVLVVGLGSVVAYLGGLIFNPEQWVNYSLILIVIGSLTYSAYVKIDKNLRGISSKIRSLV